MPKTTVIRVSTQAAGPAATVFVQQNTGFPPLICTKHSVMKRDVHHWGFNMVPSGIRCPKCLSEALYRYGKTHTGKHRFFCLICGRQFTLENKRRFLLHRPDCPTCGRPMHLYMNEGNVSRFRCSCYPECRTYLKVPESQGVRMEAL
jgi:transposase-like protein